ncbi:cytochrome c peroxidase [Microcoleus sp. PH2017_05_CCC_O_A]|uniref:cytochrome-c peroxidase n=1 Tax=Microcoleus sp. PH2017_05_CCC_O_A TaxID=2798816 RepID=UPI0025E5A9F4|nr:cytochrome c peroxidase [Microcoleus sp. PH2017_05_CCC_O_A]
MKILAHFIKLIVLTIVFFSLTLSSVRLSYAMDLSGTAGSSESVSYLNLKLKTLLNYNASGNQGLEYFILPNSLDLDRIPADPKNPLTPEKVHLGQLLFHETALSINPVNPQNWKEGSCASCHFAQAGFRSNLPQALGVGGLGWNRSRQKNPEIYTIEIDKQTVLTPSVLNSAYQDIMLWDGRAGSGGQNTKEPVLQKLAINRFKLQGLETQAIDGMKVHRMGTAAIAIIPEYQELFAKAFADRPYVGADVEDIVRAGLAIAAYERTLLANQAPFQRWLKGDENAISARELRGAITFFSSSCVQCHSGPNLANTKFHAVGFADHPKDLSGLNLGRGAVTGRANDDFKFKVPQLYNLADSSPYGHGASFNTLREVVEYFNLGEPQKLEAKYSGNLSLLFRPLNLTKEQVDDLTAFLETGLRDPNLIRYVPDRLPSGLCFPNNDPESRKQVNCD